MTFEEIMDAVKKAVQDTELGSECPEDLKYYVNKALVEVTEECVCVIPSLKSVEVALTTQQPSITMPEGFSRLLLIVPQNSGNYYGQDNTAPGVPIDNWWGHRENEIEVLKDGLEGLLKRYPRLDKIGNVHMVAVEGNIVWYQGIPSTPEPLIVLYAKYPKWLAGLRDIPIDVPEYLHKDTIVNRTAELIFRDIEDGLEGDKLNTNRYHAYYLDGMNRLNQFLIKRRSNMSRSVWNV